MECLGKQWAKAEPMQLVDRTSSDLASIVGDGDNPLPSSSSPTAPCPLLSADAGYQIAYEVPIDTPMPTLLDAAVAAAEFLGEEDRDIGRELRA